MERKHVNKLMKYVLVGLLIFSLGIGTYPILFGSNGSFTPPDLYLDDLPFSASYVVKTDGSYFWSVEDNGNILANSTNDDSIVQGAIDNASSDGGGLIFVRSGSYSASVTVKNDTLLMLEIGVSGITYTTESTGIVLRYSDGYAILDGNLNMTGNQIVSGVFHSGSTAPASPTEAQWFYDTDDHTLYVYNSTDWVNCFEGGTGSTHIAEGSYSYLIYKEGSTYYLKNGSTEENDIENTNASYVWQTCINTLASIDIGGSIFAKAGIYEMTTTLSIDSMSNILIQGEGWGEGSSGKGTRLKNIVWGNNLLNITDTKVDLVNICFDQDNKNGDIIYIKKTTSDTTMRKAHWENVYLRGNNAGFSALRAENSYWCNWDSLWIDTWGNGVFLENLSPTSHWGNSRFGYLEVRAFADATSGIYKGIVHFKSNTKELALISIDHLQLWGAGYYDGNVAVYLEGATYIHIDCVNIESVQNGFEVASGSKSIDIDGGGSFWDCGNGTLMKVNAGASTVTFKNAWCWTNSGGSPTLINDAVGSTFENLRTGTATGGFNGTDTLHANTILKGMIKQKWGEYSGTSEASNDDWIAHNLIREPTFVSLTVEETNANYTIQLKATNSTHFQIYLNDNDAGVPETVDQTINWFADT